MINVDTGFWTTWAIIILAVTSLAWLCVRTKSPHVRAGWILAALIVSIIPALGRQIALPGPLDTVQSQLTAVAVIGTAATETDSVQRQPAVAQSTGGTAATQPVPATETPFPFAAALVVLWISVATVLMVRTVVAVVAAQRLVKSAEKTDSPTVRRADVQTPMVAGFPKAYVLIPHNWPSDLSKEDADAVIRHEESHLKGRHITLRIFAEAACSWMWFSPASWALVKRLDEAFEQSADFDAIENGASAKGLARALVTLAGRATGPTQRFAIGAVHTGSRLEERIKKLKEYQVMKTKTRKTIFALIAVAGIAASAGAWTLTAQAPAKTMDFGLKPGAVWTYERHIARVDREAKIPFLSDIPVIGSLFGGQSFDRQNPPGGGTATNQNPPAGGTATSNIVRTSTETAQGYVDVQGKKALEIATKYNDFERTLYRYVRQDKNGLFQYHNRLLNGPGVNQREAPDVLIVLPIVKGQTRSWVAPFRGQTSGGGLTDEERKSLETHMTMTVVSTDAKVVVPAGTFTAVHFRTVSVSDAYGSSTTDSWYASGVGLVKTTTESDTGTDERVLTSFKPGK